MTRHLGLILASGSPRRKALLERAGISFTVLTSGIDEARRDAESAPSYALRMAHEKVLNVSMRSPGVVVLAADTVVECDGEILGKPVDAGDARRMLRLLSGNVHTVVTAYAIARDGAITESVPVLSRVRFRTLDDRQIGDYIATGEPFDKAGAYGIQAGGGSFIVEVEGARDNVMGLPMREVIAALARHGITPDGSRRCGRDV